MNRDEAEGKLENLKGRVKEAGGALTGDKGKQAEGLVDRGKGAVQEKIGKAERKLDQHDRDDEE